MGACSNTNLRIIPSLNWVILKLSFIATNCSLKWHISSDNKPFLVDHLQTQLNPCLWVQSWLLTSAGQLRVQCVLKQCTDLLQFLWAPNFPGGRFYLFQMQKLLHMTPLVPIALPYTNITKIKLSYPSGLMILLLNTTKWCNSRYFGDWFACLFFFLIKTNN